MTSNMLQRELSRFAREAGFQKKGHSWYRSSDQTIVVLNLQKSQYGDQYYFNVGFFLRHHLESGNVPPAHHAHVSVRLESLDPEQEAHLMRILDLDAPISDERRVREFRSVLSDVLSPIIARAETVAGVRSMAQEGAFRQGFVQGVVDSDLGLDANGEPVEERP